MPDPNDSRPTPKPFTDDTVIGDYEIKGAWRRGDEEDDADNAEGTDRITFAYDLSGRYNPYPTVEPVVRETKFC
jgi:hypothetical protein